MSHNQSHMLTAWQSRLPHFIRQRLLMRAIHDRYPVLYWMICSGMVGVDCTRGGDLVEISAFYQNLASCDFEFLNELTALRSLRLPHCTGVDNRVLRQLQNADQLETLDLTGGVVSAYGLKCLTCHENLITLDASGTFFGATSTEDCRPDTSAEELRTFGMCNIVRFTALRSLELDRTYVGDVELEQIAQLPELDYLSLFNTRVTDAGLRHLWGHPKLQLLLIASSKVTVQGIETLKMRLPYGVNVEFLKEAAVVFDF